MNWTTAQITSLRKRLLRWFEQHARDLPWRQSRDPYRVWLSEIMLQQTQVAAVIPYFERFTAALPTIAAIAAAPEEQVLRLWEGLGYYRRARQLHAAAQQIVELHGGQFPRDYDAVRRLPGIGRYTAGAILSIAFDEPQPIVEANTVRLYARLLLERGEPTSAATQARLWEFAERLVPSRQAGLLNQALMEVGSLICTPRAPQCDACPLATLCPTYPRGLFDKIPAPKKRPVREEVVQAALVVWKGRRVLVRQCGAEERWAGLWDFPRFDLRTHLPQQAHDELIAGAAALVNMRVEPQQHLTTIRHGVTRFNITLHCFAARHVEGDGENNTARALRWLEPEELDQLPLSVTGRKISRLLNS